MAGTNERRSIVDDDGWEPIEAPRARVGPLLIGFGIAFVVVPLVAFVATYLVLSR